jgi:hypothetical protein
MHFVWLVTGNDIKFSLSIPQWRILTRNWWIFVVASSMRIRELLVGLSWCMCTIFVVVGTSTNSVTFCIFEVFIEVVYNINRMHEDFGTLFCVKSNVCLVLYSPSYWVKFELILYVSGKSEQLFFRLVEIGIVVNYILIL